MESFKNCIKFRTEIVSFCCFNLYWDKNPLMFTLGLSNTRWLQTAFQQGTISKHGGKLQLKTFNKIYSLHLLNYFILSHVNSQFHFIVNVQESVQAPLVILLNASKVNGPLQFIDFWLSFEILAMKMKSDTTTVIGTNIRCTPWPTLIHQDGQYNQSNVKTYQNWLLNFF